MERPLLGLDLPEPSREGWGGQGSLETPPSRSRRPSLLTADENNNRGGERKRSRGAPEGSRPPRTDAPPPGPGTRKRPPVRPTRGHGLSDYYVYANQGSLGDWPAVSRLHTRGSFCPRHNNRTFWEPTGPGACHSAFRPAPAPSVPSFPSFPRRMPGKCGSIGGASRWSRPCGAPPRSVIGWDGRGAELLRLLEGPASSSAPASPPRSSSSSFLERRDRLCRLSGGRPSQCLPVCVCGVCLLQQLELITPFQLYFNPDLIFRKFQLWRLVTNFLFFGPLGFSFFFNMIFLYRYCRMLEEGSFRGRTADFIFMFLFGGFLMTLFGLFASLFFLGQAFTIMLVYVWSRRNPYVRMNFFGLLNFQAPFLPWVLMGFSLLLGNSIIIDLLGIAVGHVYYFLEDVFPNQPGGKKLLLTPGFLKLVFDPPEEDPNYQPLPEDDLTAAGNQNQPQEPR
nr:uncharacterized protein LOC110081966 [Pogona vitticeps]